MKPLELWHIVAANVLVLAMFLAIRRWDRGLRAGHFGLVLIVLPVAFAYFQGRLAMEESLAPVVGAIILAADLKGKLPRGKTSPTDSSSQPNRKN